MTTLVVTGYVEGNLQSLHWRQEQPDNLYISLQTQNIADIIHDQSDTPIKSSKLSENKMFTLYMGVQIEWYWHRVPVVCLEKKI